MNRTTQFYASMIDNKAPRKLCGASAWPRKSSYPAREFSRYSRVFFTRNTRRDLELLVGTVSIALINCIVHHKLVSAHNAKMS